ncbi:hypothetical protein ANCCAN_28329 [Ancylostoma caninum]|uniref:Uncharacterized protein n=1 Tax=Ancylostoma caninum TaxID=29170 RepID=A0A368F1I1_ANCCA|nr:hypothetical protein ANCCAN_28329 [Ancylostoma caninum]
MDTDATFVPYNSSNDEEDDKEGGMEVDSNAVVVSSGRTKKMDKDLGENESATLPTILVIDGNVQLNRVIKKAVKKNKRAARKQEQRANKLADAMDTTSL